MTNPHLCYYYPVGEGGGGRGEGGGGRGGVLPIPVRVCRLDFTDAHAPLF